MFCQLEIPIDGEPARRMLLQLYARLTYRIEPTGTPAELVEFSLDRRGPMLIATQNSDKGWRSIS